ncbi:MAG: hypothetical protein GX606_07230, partial [Elusimicrobia bacterium]|nr:hypothetical protein [Elusimicrobiota bacterium]
MIEGLLERGPNGEYDELAEILRRAEETTNVADRFQQWARGRSADVVRTAEEALNRFMNEFLPNNISVVREFARDLLNVHLAAAYDYGDLEYHRLARDMFRRYGSLLFAVERLPQDDPDREVFVRKFRSYQKSAKLKTVGMLQYVLAWSSSNEFRQTSRYERQEDFDPNVVRIAEYSFLSKAAESVLALPASPLRDRFEAMLVAATQDPDSGLKYVRTIDGTRAVVFCRQMRDMARLFLKFREENYADILALPSSGREAGLFAAVYEIMLYVEESARSEAIIPFYDKRLDDILTANKNGMINLNVWMNLGRSWNMDAGVRAYPGQSLSRLTYASYAGQNPHRVVVNPAFRVWTTSNNAFPGIRRYKIAQETFTQDTQRSSIPTGYGKFAIHPAAGNSVFDTPGEDSANYILALDEYTDLESTQEDFMPWEWGRMAQHSEATSPTEGRYVGNVTRFEMDTGLFEINLNPDVGYDVKKTNDRMFNHYLFASISSALLILVPLLQGFTGFAFLAPALVFVPLAFMAMQAINFQNFFRHWREEGSVLMMLATGLKEVAEAFSYYVSMIPTFIKNRLLAANEAFKFNSTIKTLIFGSADRDTRMMGLSRIEWTAQGNQKMATGFRAGGVAGMALGAGLLAAALPAVGLISANLLWLGPVVAGFGGLAAILGTVIKYQHRTLNGKEVGPIPIPLTNVLGVAGIAAWLAGVFFTTSLGPVVTILYLLASIAALTGGNVYDTVTERIVDEDGTVHLRMRGQDHWAMFTDNPRALKVFLIALAAVVGLTFAPAAIPAAASAALHWLLYGVMFESIRRGAFSNIWHATKFTFKEIGRYLRDV